jgi:spermidine synthase
VGRAVQAKLEHRALHVGIIGLGVGTLASYGRAGDHLRLYEINPMVVDIARSHFTYLSQSAAQAELVIGDARLNLEKETPQEFDILIVDAFSGDAIPVHLLTQEAIKLYIKHMKPDGILAIHVTNVYLDLAQVVKTAADNLKYHAALIHTGGNEKSRATPSDWVLVSADRQFFGNPHVKEALTEIKVRPGLQAWRDDYSSLLQVIWRGDGK